MLKVIRIILAVISFIAVTLLFVDVTGFAVTHWGWMAKIQLVPAILALNFVVVGTLLVMTLLFGRIYCSIICPLGILQDAISKIHELIRNKKAKNRYSFEKAYTALRISFLVMFVTLLVLGLTSIASLIEPYGSFGRIVTQLVRPLSVDVNNLSADIAWHHGSTAYITVAQEPFSVLLFFVALISLVIVGFMSWIGGREYCNTICPVGTFLGFISRFSLFRPIIDIEKCNGCTKCARNCKAKCINAQLHKIDYSRCVVCMDCIGKCKQGAISYGTAHSKSKDEVNNNEERRRFLGMSLILTSSLIGKSQRKIVDGGLAPIVPKKSVARKKDIVPPGAKSIKNLSDRCTACQLCISTCPSNVLRPSTQLDSLMQPRMEFDKGYCRPECTKCSDVCPTGAIINLDQVEKSSISVGRAEVDLDTCLSANWNQEDGGQPCHGCERHCPTGAITIVPVDKDNPKGKMMPVVNESICIGCGACENLCPVNPISAIRVNGYEVHRSV